MILVDGKTLAADLLEEVAAEIKKLSKTPHLEVITCAPNFETRKYLALKQSKASALGIKMDVTELPAASSTAELEHAVRVAGSRSTGVIVQLPLPFGIDVGVVLAAVPTSHDVDAFSYSGESGAVLPPVVGAIARIAEVHDIAWTNKKVVVFGQGRLVGVPAAAFARSAGADVTVLTESSTNSKDIARSADIIILGVGIPSLLTVAMVKEGVVVFDAGASEDGGLLVGDADPAVADKAALFTPVPGGIGPMTIALLFYNLVELQKRQ